MPRSGAAFAGSPDATAPGLSVRGVSFERRDGTRAVPVLQQVSFEIPRGRLVALVGPSGAGKSTLLSLLAGFERPTSGSIAFGGVDWAPLSPCERAVGMSFDDAALHEHLSVAMNVDSAALPRGEPADRRRDRVTSLLRSLGIAHLADRRPAALSAGERRRVAIARVFIRSPQLVLLDEPFANLDRANRFTVRQMVRELQRSIHATTIVVTHDPTDALAIADDLMVLVRSEVRAFGPAGAIADRPPDLEVAQLVDDLGMHVLEVAANGVCTDARISEKLVLELAERRARARVETPTLVGMRPWQIRVGAPTEPSIELDAKLLACEPAGLFADLIALRSDGRTLRARVPRANAQELPIGSRITFHIHEREAQFFAGPWPGRRLD
jgi:ABC-type sugar transport system ATPase subunit